MMSRSGVLVLPENDEAPPLEDIALSLSRQPRFGGHTVDPWSVAEHCMVVAKLARQHAGTALSVVELHALLHDAHESVTGDIPTTWKSPAMQAAQELLDLRIYRSLHLPRPFAIDRELIKKWDRAALLAEAKVVATPGVYEVIRGTGTEAERDALVAVGDIMARHFTQQSACAFYYAWAKRLVEIWRADD